MQFSIVNRTRKTIPRIPFERIKDKVLGKRYELSLVLCGDALSRQLNKRYRGKNKVANILSFPLSESSGEIFINLATLKGFSVVHLFIHGLLHLKGMEHGDTMSRAEKKLLHGATNYRRD